MPGNDLFFNGLAIGIHLAVTFEGSDRRFIMPSQIMENLIESDSRGISRGAVIGKLVSAGIQLGVITLMIVIPLLATDALPEPPEAMMTFLAPPPPPPPPPPAPPAAAKPQPVRAKAPSIPRPVPASDFVAPVEVPNEIPTEEFASDTGYVAGGVDTGGVPGGIVGGVEGGMPGAPADEPVRVGGEIQPPKKVKDVRPEYPSTARTARVEGTVILEAVIDTRGLVADVRVLKSIPLLDEAAVEAVKQWRYQATLLNGEAVPIVMTVTVNFGLDKA
jgi:periplasmic protein TonB